MSDLKTLIKATLKKYGKDAAKHFGMSESTLAKCKLSGRYPTKFIDQILAEGMPMVADHAVPPVEDPPPSPEPVPPPPPTVTSTTTAMPSLHQFARPDLDKRLDDVVKYIQQTVDFYIKQFAARITVLERTCAALSSVKLRSEGVSLARPDQGVPVEQTFTTNPNPQFFPPRGNSLDTGIAPTKEMVDAQANMTIIEGVPVPGAELARPAEYIPDQPSFGFGWNQPRPQRK
jgi:hypothetical protein